MLNKKDEFDPEFDAIDKSMLAYKAVWQGRFYIARLFMIPFVIKVICYMAIFYLGYEEDILRQTLIMIPSFFADGWLIAQWLRTLGMGEKWPYKYNLDEKGVPKEKLRIKAILSAIQVYVLIKLTMGGMVAMTMMSENKPPPETVEVTGGGIIGVILAIVALLSIIWCYRLAWLHVPFVMNCSMTKFVKMVGGLMGSIKIIGMSLVCMVPLYMFLLFTASFVLSLAGIGEGQETPMEISFILTLFSSIGEIVIALISASAVLLAYKGLMVKKDV